MRRSWSNQYFVNKILLQTQNMVIINIGTGNTYITQWESRGTSQKNNFFKKCSVTSVTLWSIKRKNQNSKFRKTRLLCTCKDMVSIKFIFLVKFFKV